MSSRERMRSGESFDSSSDSDSLQCSWPSSDEELTTSSRDFAEASDLFSAGQKGLLASSEQFTSTFARFTYSRVTAGDQHLSRLKADKKQPSVFFRSRKAPICITEYVRRIAVHSKCSPVCFASAYIYLQRLSKTGDQFSICSGSVHRLLIAGVLIAAKLMDDKFYSNSFYARIGGISTKEMNRLELEMLKLLDFKAFISHVEICEVLDQMLTCADSPFSSRIPSGTLLRVSKKRGKEIGQPASDCRLPVKLQHDSKNDQVLVTQEAQRSESQAPVQESRHHTDQRLSLKCQESERAASAGLHPAQIHLPICAGGE